MAVWPDLAKFRRFGNTLKIFGDILYYSNDIELAFIKMYAIVRIFFAVNGHTVQWYYLRFLKRCR